MRKLVTFILIIVANSGVFAQWEKVGYPGGGLQIYQFDDVLIGSSGSEIYKSTDDGEHWKLFVNGLPVDNFIQYYSIFSVNDTIYLRPAGLTSVIEKKYKGTYFRATLEDNEWEEWKGNPFPKSYIHTLSDDTIVYIGAFPEGSTFSIPFVVSIDGGATWTERAVGLPGGFGGIYEYSFEREKIVVQISYQDTVFTSDTTFSLMWVNGFYLSFDLGLNWQKMITSVSDSLYQYQHLYKIDSLRYVFMASYFGLPPVLLYSNDACSSWEDTLLGIDVEVIASVWQFQKFDSILFLSLEDALIPDPNVKCYVSYDFGRTWNRKNDLTFSRRIDNIYQKKARDGYLMSVYTGKDNVFVLDSDFTMKGPLVFNDIHEGRYSTLLVEDSVIIGAVYPNKLQKSDGEGIEWNSVVIDSVISGNAADNWSRGHNFTFMTIGHSMDYYKLQRSSNSGYSWDSVKMPADIKGRFAFANTNDTLVVYYLSPDSLRGLTFLSVNGGDDWKQINTPFTDYYSIRHIFLSNGLIYFVPSDRWLYAQSSNLGETWSNNDIMDYQFTHNADYTFFISDNWEYCFGSKQVKDYNYTPYVLRNKKGEQSWELLKTNLPAEVRPSSMVQVGNFLFMLSLSYNDKINNDGTCRVFKSSDNGVTWIQVGEALDNGYQLYYNDKYLFISCSEYRPGLYRYPLALAGIHDTKPNSNNSLSISAYPNPTTKELTISHTSGQAERVVMYDMTGALVRSDVVSGEATWDVSALPSGSYMLGIPGGKMQVVQVVK